MTKSKSRSEVDHLRGEIKKLKKELARKNKNRSSVEEVELEYIVTEPKSKKHYPAVQHFSSDNSSFTTNRCPKCSDDLEVIGGDKIKIYICQGCSYRSSVRR